MDDVDVDLARVRFVAGRYRELQGLRTVIDVVTFLVVWWLLQIPPAQRTAVPYIGVLLIWGAFATFATWGASRVARSYRERFGVAADGQDTSAWLRILLIWLVIGQGWVLAVVPTGLAVYGLRVAWRDWPHRSHWLLVALVGVAFGLAFPGGHSPHLDDWQWRFVWAAAPVLIVAGVLDHRLLVRAMHRAPHTTPDTEHADTI
jgi:hypothetical protein